MDLLSEQEIDDRLATLDRWRLEDAEIVREYEFKDFVGSIDFVNKVADLAEGAGHHPDIAVSWNRVTLTLSTHSKGGLTDGDFKLATQIDSVID